MTKPTDPLVAAFSSAPAAHRGGLRLDMDFADRPEVLEAIRQARKTQRLSYGTIAKIIRQVEPDKTYAESTIGTWLRRQGIE